MKQQELKTVKSTITTKGRWSGFLVANKRDTRTNDGCWYLGFKVTLTSLVELEKTVERLTHYNRQSELKNLVSFYAK